MLTAHDSSRMCNPTDRPDAKHRMVESLAVPSGARNADFSPYRAVTPGGYLPMSRAYGDHRSHAQPTYGQRKPPKDVPDHKLNPYRFARDKMKAITESGEPCTNTRSLRTPIRTSYSVGPRVPVRCPSCYAG